MWKLAAVAALLVGPCGRDSAPAPRVSESEAKVVACVRATPRVDNSIVERLPDPSRREWRDKDQFANRAVCRCLQEHPAGPGESESATLYRAAWRGICACGGAARELDWQRSRGEHLEVFALEREMRDAGCDL